MQRFALVLIGLTTACGGGGHGWPSFAPGAAWDLFRASP
jgi:hypothetical protein